MTSKRWLRSLFLAAAAAAAFALSGCGDDEPTNPGGNNTGDDFNETAAVTQASVAAPQAAALAQSITSIADGVGAKDGIYAWNAETMRWEYHYVYSGAGYDYDWTYTAQYLDGEGTPQQYAAGAATVVHTMHGDMDFASNQGGYNVTYDYVYDYDVTISGVGTSLYTMTGSGGYDVDYHIVGPSYDQTASYVVDWETVDGGITVAPGGCPSGTIRYTFDPYHLDVVFDGSSTATHTLYNGSGGVVASGSGTYPLSCGS